MVRADRLEEGLLHDLGVAQALVTGTPPDGPPTCDRRRCFRVVPSSMDNVVQSLIYTSSIMTSTPIVWSLRGPSKGVDLGR